MELHTSVAYLKGVGPARARMLETKGILTVEDLLCHVPFRYEDRTNTKPIAQLSPGEMATVVAEVNSADVVRFRRSAMRMFQVRARDRSGVLLCKWFHGDYLAGVLAPGQRVAFYGKIEFENYSGELSILHPEYEILSGDEEGGAGSRRGPSARADSGAAGAAAASKGASRIPFPAAGGRSAAAQCLPDAAA